jgi:hypothetical protein
MSTNDERAKDAEALLAIASDAWNQHQANCRITTVSGSLQKVCEAISAHLAARLDSLAGENEGLQAEVARLQDLFDAEVAAWRRSDEHSLRRAESAERERDALREALLWIRDSTFRDAASLRAYADQAVNRLNAGDLAAKPKGEL